MNTLTFTPCDLCEGTGGLKCTKCWGSGEGSFGGSCDRCRGDGGAICPKCDQTGELVVTHLIQAVVCTVCEGWTRRTDLKTVARFRDTHLDCRR